MFGSRRCVSALAARIVTLCLVFALGGCKKEPCHGNPEARWNAEGAWDFLGTLPLDEGAVCRADDRALSIDHGVGKDRTAEVEARWRSWLTENGWQEEPEGPWNREEREDPLPGLLGIYAREGRGIVLRVRGTDVGVLADVSRLRRRPHVPVDEARFEAGERRLAAVREATAAWRAADSKPCEDATVAERKGDRPAPLLLIDRDGLGLMDEAEDEAFGQYIVTDRAVREPPAADESDHAAWSQSVTARERRAKVFEASPLAVVFHARAGDLVEPRITNLPGDETADGKPLTTFRAGRVSGHLLIVDADAGEVVCHLPVAAESSADFETTRRDAKESLWVDLMVRTDRAIQAKLQALPSIAKDFRARGARVTDLFSTGG